MFDIVICDKSSPNSKQNIDAIVKQYPYARTVRYWDNYLSTINRSVDSVRTSHFWFVSSECDLKDWDFNWQPDAWEKEQIHCWSNNQNKFGSVFLIPKRLWIEQGVQRLEQYKDINYHQAQYKSEQPYKFLADIDADNLASGVHHIRRTGNFHNLVTRCCESSPTELFYLFLDHQQPLEWIYRDLPDPGWNQSTAYHFHKPEQKYGEIFLINKRKYLSSGVTAFSDLDDMMYVSVDTIKSVQYKAVVLQHTDLDVHPCSDHYPTSYIRFFGNYLSSFRRLPKVKDKLWVFSDIVDYENFDWSYMSAPWNDKVDVWPSGNQKQGDTFLLSAEFLKSVDQLTAIHEWPNIDYNHIAVVREKWPVVNWYGDNLADIIKATTFTADYVFFNHMDIKCPDIQEPSFWSEPNVWDQGARGAHALVPKQAKSSIDRQVYDYDLILRSTNSRTTEFPQNVFFISYDETNADSNYQKLLKQTSVHRIHGIQGMVPALKKCAEAATTPWFWAVFGKTKIVDNFNWSWTPDFFKNPCNYVFHGYNPVLEHAYGHGGVVLYNTEWVETVKEWGFDFTMSFELETVPIVSTYVDYANTPMTAWRTAVREGYKLAYYLNRRPSVEDSFILDLWLTREATENGPWSRLGAHMGQEMFKQGIDYDRLMDWDWLRETFEKLLTISKVPQECFAYPVDLLVTKIGMHR